MVPTDASLYAPAYMRSLKQWCYYRIIKSQGKERKQKVPFNPNRPSGRASSTNPNTWSSIDHAIEQCNIQHGDGIAFMLQKDNGLSVVDFDDCIDGDGSVDPVINYWINELDSYTEISQSGTGFHVVLMASMSIAGRKSDKDGVEVYREARQICMQPNVYKGMDHIKANNTQALNELMAQYFPDYDPNAKEEAVPAVKLDICEAENAELQNAIERFTTKQERKDLWNHTQDDEEVDVSQSGVDWAIALAGVRMGLSDGIVGALIVRNRQMFGQEQKLKDHPNYVGITVGNAKRSVDKQKARNEIIGTGCLEFRDTRTNEVSDVTGEVIRIESREEECGALGPTFKLLTCNEVMAHAREVEWLARGYIPLDSLVWLFGEPSRGKSFAAMSLIVSVAHTGTWGSIPVTKGGAVYACGEGLSGLGKRLQGLKQELLIKDDMPNLTITSEPVLFTEVPQVADFLNKLKAHFATAPAPLRLLIVDTKNTCMAGNENDAEVMTRFNRNLRTIQREFACAILVIDHVGHQDKTRTRGHTVQLGAADAAYLFEGDDSFIPNGSTAFRSILKVSKPPKDFEAPEALEFDAKKVSFEFDTKQMTTLVMVPTSSRVTYKPTVPLEELSKMQRICLNVLSNHHELAQGSNGHNPVRTTLKAWRKMCSDDEVMSRQTAHRECGFLIDNNFAIKIPPKGNKHEEEGLWLVAPMDR